MHYDKAYWNKTGRLKHASNNTETYTSDCYIIICDCSFVHTNEQSHWIKCAFLGTKYNLFEMIWKPKSIEIFEMK